MVPQQPAPSETLLASRPRQGISLAGRLRPPSKALSAGAMPRMNPWETDTDKQTQVLGTQMTIAGDRALVNSTNRFKNQQATPMVGKGGIKLNDDTLHYWEAIFYKICENSIREERGFWKLLTGFYGRWF